MGRVARSSAAGPMRSTDTRSRGLATTARFTGLDQAGRWTEPRLIQALRDRAGAPGSLEINVHPGAAGDPARERFAWGYGWDEERRALTSPELRRAVERLGFDLRGR